MRLSRWVAGMVVIAGALESTGPVGAVSAPAVAAKVELAAVKTAPAPRASSLALGVYDPADSFAGSGDLGIEHVFIYWQQIDTGMLRSKIAYAAARHRRMMVTVEPYTKASDFRSGGEHLFGDILAGRFDAQIDAACGEVARIEGRPIVRWGHEMEEPVARYPWARTDASGYKDAYRYFVDRCRSAAPQAVFMWSPKGRPNLADYYPGGKWVDMVGLSVYGLQAWDRKFLKRDRDFDEVFGEEYRRVSGFGKPVAIAELGVAGSDAYRQTWLSELGGSRKGFPLLNSIVYFNAKEPSTWPAGLGSPDWRVPPGQFGPTGRGQSADASASASGRAAGI